MSRSRLGGLGPQPQVHDHKTRRRMAETPAPAAAANRRRNVFIYFGLLTFLVSVASPHAYLLDVASAYMLKNQLHATASQISAFRVLTAAPIYFSIVLGL